MYAIYKGDEFIFMGSAKECAEFLGVKVRTIYSLTSASHHNRIKENGNAVLAIKVEGIEEDVETVYQGC